jgi:transcriptional regulator of heat shock response
VDAKKKLVEMMETAKLESQRLELESRSCKSRILAFEEALVAASQDKAAMQVSRKLESKIKSERQSITEIEQKLHDAMGRVSAFDEAIKMFPKDGEESELRANSKMSKIQTLLKNAGKPLSLAEILKGIGEENENARNSIRGSLAGYAKDGRVFTKEETPDTFGLIAFKREHPSITPPTV